MMSKLANRATAGFRRGFRPVEAFGSDAPGCTPSYTPPRKPSFLSRNQPRACTPVLRVPGYTAEVKPRSMSGCESTVGWFELLVMVKREFG